jgi:pyruvate dehydrogenase E1 component alpha subunit
LAAQLEARDEVAVVCVGDGAVNQGVFHEAANLSGLWSLPVVFLVENNGYAISVKTERSSSILPLAERAKAYGLRGERVEDNDPVSVYEKMGEAVRHARAGGGATFLEVVTDRLAGAFEGDRQLYRPDGELERLQERDALPRFERFGVDEGWLNTDAIERVWADARAEVMDAMEFARQSPHPSPGEAFQNVFVERSDW